MTYLLAAAGGFAVGSVSVAYLGDSAPAPIPPTLAGIGVALLALIATACVRTELTTSDTRRLAAAAAATASAGQRLASLETKLGSQYPVPTFDNWTLSPDTVCHIVDELRRRQAPVVVELGAGRTSPLIAQLACETGGRYLGIDHSEQWAREVRQWCPSAPNHDVNVIHAPLRSCVYGGWWTWWYDQPSVLEALGDARIDVLIVDGPSHTSGPYTRSVSAGTLSSRVAHDGLVVIDDTERPEEARAVAAWEQSVSVCRTMALAGPKRTTLLFLGADSGREPESQSGVPA